MVASETLWVVAAALISADGRVLVQQRPPGRAMPGLWEFPGGKVEPGEPPDLALVREVREELGIGIDLPDMPSGLFVTTQVGERPLVLMLYICRVWQGDPAPLHASRLQWCHLAELEGLPMPPADVPLVEMLRAVTGPAPSR